MTNVGGSDAGFGSDGSRSDGEAVLDVVLEGAEVGVWILDLNTGRTETMGPYGRILTGGPTEPNFTFESYEAFLEVVHPEDRDRIAGSVARNRRSTKFEDEFRVLSPTGGVRWLLSRSRVVPDDHGGQGRVVGVVMDVTERHEAARRREQLHSLAEVGLSSLGLDALLDELLRRVVAMLETDSATILLLDRDGRLRVRASVGLEPSLTSQLAVLVGEGFAGRIAATGQPLRIDAAETDIATPNLRASGLRYLMGVPLIVEARTIGVLHVGRRDVPLGDDDLPVLQTVADRVALAIDRARAYEHQRAIADTLQQNLLPYQLPRVPGVRLAAAYRPGQAEAAVGGDWYDALALADGRVAVSIGDVAGHGVEAAQTMGRLRDVTRLLVAEGRPIEDVLLRLNHMILGLSSEALATAVCLIVDPANATALWSSAGHPPPLLRRPSGSTTFLDQPGGPALGVTAGAHYAVNEIALEPGSLIVLYTDGLVERRDEHMQVGLERLADLVTATAGSASAQCATLTEEGGPLPHGDDVAVVAIEIRRRLEPLNMRFPLEADSLAQIRVHLRRWLHEVLDACIADDLVQAASDAAAKVVAHRPTPPGEIALSASSAGDSVEISVRTRRPPDDEMSGWPGTDDARALLIMEALTDELIVLNHPDGNEVILRRLTP